MMNRSHVTSGLAVGLVVGHLIGLTTVLAVTPFAVIVAGFASFNDLDCCGSAPTQMGGPVTRLMSRVLRASSRCLYNHTRGPRDPAGTGEHRGMTHTWPFCLAFTVLLEGAVLLWGLWVTAAIVAFALLAVVDRLGPWLLIPVALSALAWYATSVATHVPLAVVATHNTHWVACAAGLGCLTHMLGDSPTLAGVPWAFPFMWRGQRWRAVKVPRWMRFRVGSAVEVRFVFPALVAATVLAVPGVLPHLVALAEHGGSGWTATTASG